MAQIREIRLVDDLDGETADETVEFGIDGKSYEIDLSKENAGRLRDALAARAQLLAGAASALAHARAVRTAPLGNSHSSSR